MIRITIELDGAKGMAEENGVDAECLLRVFRHAAMAAGFHPDTVIEIVGEDGCD